MPVVLSSISPTHGPRGGGNTVTFSGSGFTSSLEIQFGGVFSSATIVSSNQATAVAPVHSPGTVPILLGYEQALAVVSLTGTPSSATVLLSWSAPTNAVSASVTGYRVWEIGSGSVDVASTTASMGNLTNFTTCSFMVYALGSAGPGVLSQLRAVPFVAPVVPANSQFNTAITATAEQAEGTWWIESGTSGASTTTAGNLSSSEMTPPCVGNMLAHNISPGASNVALCYKFSRATIDASGSELTWDVRIKSSSAGNVSTGGYVDIRGYDTGSNWITSSPSRSISIFDWQENPAQIVSGVTISPYSLNTNYTCAFDLKGFVVSRLNGGKTWADISYVITRFFARDAAATTADIQWFIDNFR